MRFLLFFSTAPQKTSFRFVSTAQRHGALGDEGVLRPHAAAPGDATGTGLHGKRNVKIIFKIIKMVVGRCWNDNIFLLFFHLPPTPGGKGSWWPRNAYLLEDYLPRQGAGLGPRPRPGEDISFWFMMVIDGVYSDMFWIHFVVFVDGFWELWHGMLMDVATALLISARTCGWMIIVLCPESAQIG